MPSTPAIPVLPEIDEATVRRFGERYIAGRNAPYRAVGRPFFIDKMPNNFRHIGLIHLILPKAGSSTRGAIRWTAAFPTSSSSSQGQEFTYSIEDIARYYRTYLDLMRHWDAVCPAGPASRQRRPDRRSRNQIRRLLDRAAAVRESLPQFPPDPSQRAHAELRTGPPPDQPRWHRPVAPA
jgi:hypothetical protein